MKKLHEKIYLALVLVMAFSISLSAQTPLNESSLNPPSNLDGEIVADNDAQLSWDAPAADQIYLHWDDGEFYSEFGFMLNAANFDIASKWDPSHLTAYDGWEIVGVRFFVTHSSASLKIKVWEGEDDTQIYTEDVTSFTEDDWTEITLANPVTIDVSKTLHAGLNIDMPFGAPVMGHDKGPAIDGYGNLYRYEGTWYSDFDNNYLFQILIAPKSAPRSTSEMLGYNVYRDDEKVNANTVTAPAYVDKDLFNGSFKFN